MTNHVHLPSDTKYRRLITKAKNFRLLNQLFKYLHIARRLEVNKISAGAVVKPTEVICDIGCGDGFWSNYLGGSARALIGLDPFMTDLAKSAAYRTYRSLFVNAVAESLPIASESVDKVVSVCVFEHCFDDKQAFAEAYRILRKGGRLVATVDSLNSPYLSETHREQHRKSCYINQFYDIDSLTEKLRTAGFTSVEATYMMGSRLAIWWEIRLSKYGAILNLLSPLVYPFLVIAESGKQTSGYKIFVVAHK
jgi:SAM-dependent methyltransferase